MQMYMILFFVSFALCSIIILLSAYGLTRRAALDEVAVQSAHSGFVPRVGGIAIYLSMIVVIPLLNFGFIPITALFDIKLYEITWLVFSVTPIFLIGIAEDFGYSMAPKKRLMACAFSSLFALFAFRVWISSLGIPLVDNLLLFAPLGILFTIFASVGVVNAFNLIDGLNGLSSYTTISTAIALSIISFQGSELPNLNFFVIFIRLRAWIFGFKLSFR